MRFNHRLGALGAGLTLLVPCLAYAISVSAPATTMAAADGSFSYVAQVDTHDLGTTPVYSYAVTNSGNTQEPGFVADCFCMPGCGTVGGGPTTISNKLIDRTRGTTVTVSLQTCGAGTFSASTQVLPFTPSNPVPALPLVALAVLAPGLIALASRARRPR